MLNKTADLSKVIQGVSQGARLRTQKLEPKSGALSRLQKQNLRLGSQDGVLHL